MHPKPLNRRRFFEGKSMTGGSDWSTLPVEILNIIVEKLEHFGDRLSLSSVCKDWRIPVTPRPLLWVAAFTNNGVFSGTNRSVTITFQFHEICSNVKEPCHPRPYKRSFVMLIPFFAEPKPKVSNWCCFIRRKLLPDIPDDPLSDDFFFAQPRIKESKLGWLVVSMSYNKFICSVSYQLVRKCLFVYNPFSAPFMSLPDLPLEHHTVTFSGSDPTSPECVFFVIVFGLEHLSIHTWSPGQEVWKERHVIVKDNYWSKLCSVTWLDGIFYWCYGTHMESFNPSNGERKEVSFPSQLAGKNLFRHHNKLYELNGEILLFVYDVDPTKRIDLFFKFNPFEGTWIRGDDFLNDWLLFMSDICPSSYSVSGYGNTSSCRAFRNYFIRNHCKDDADMKKKTAVECLMMDCLAKTKDAIKFSDMEWLSPPLKNFG